jgi:hypothetical protein
MAKVTPISEHYQHFLADVKETFWGDLLGPGAPGSRPLLGANLGDAIPQPRADVSSGH